MRKSKNKKEIERELKKLQANNVTPYRIGSGDRFDISIYGEPELTIKNGVVKPDGTLTAPMVGDVKVSGLSINHAMKKISQKMQQYMKKPIVSLIPSQFRAQTYTILGKINKPGNYMLHENSRVLDTIAEAGGLSIGVFRDNTIELADLEHAFIRRGDKVLPVNFIELVRKGNPLHNIPLKDKDYIYIPSALNTEIYLLGELKTSGYYGYKENMTLSQAIVYTGGYKDTANINKIAVIRGYLNDPTVYLVDLEKVLEGKAADFRLKPYDIVFVPKSTFGDWNTLLDMLTPSLQVLTSGYISYQLFSGESN
ncbi:polysaccharide biosynthesis/export family protein [Sulfurovum sp. ST-21]|uniref:Polysaccharide biosynthesis/export family protein n=1 Tax=Sulfurovum indicum TaxID=2779528 RepID=A0A7M1S4E4_9BACT|nr:polysaccharide biosynthesis/export family protein [Sulfurovum indicum]QOR61952.1 polysaccharide biosynthesis/export family protein [Sulfurovum indicum]